MARSCLPLRRLLSSIALVSISLPIPQSVQAEDGQWTPSQDWSGGSLAKYAVHLALLPGDGAPYHSRILWFASEQYGSLNGGEWGWLTGNDGCANFPSASFAALPLGLSGMNIFCSGVTALSDGRLLIAGGTDSVTGNYGEDRTRILARGSGTSASTWIPTATMSDKRWYASATTMKDGRVFVGGGSRHRHHRHFGGRRDGAAPSSPAGDRVERFSPINGGAWDSYVVPLPDGPNRPEPRESHTYVEMGGLIPFGAPLAKRTQVVFGGLNGNGNFLGDTWCLTRDNNQFGSDYTYQWKQVAQAGPDPRSDHTAVPMPDASMIVFGGRDDDGARSDTWYLRPIVGGYEWLQMLISGNPPSARFGHAAFSDVNTISGVKRMIVFGGAPAVGQAPSDLRVYELRIDSVDPGRGTWSELAVSDLGSPAPAPRAWHAMAHDPQLRTGPGSKFGRATFLFGGDLGNGVFSDSLWILWAFEDGTIGWELKAHGGPVPSARARHGMLFDPEQGDRGDGGHPDEKGYGRLYIYGGEDGSGPVDRYTYVLDPWPSGDAVESWQQWDDHGFTLSRHGAVLDRELTLSRVVEVYDPATNAFQVYSNHPNHWAHTYPVNFVVPGSTTAGGRLVSAGQDRYAYWLDLPATGSSPPSAWSPAGGLDAGFTPRTGVLYEPGKIMVAGGAAAGQITGLTKTLDMTSGSPAWSSSGAMSPRDYHNLVLLPTGQVLAVGGYAGSGHASAVKRPQIWTPSTGTWTPLSQLPEQPTVRGYHSTAILLPDGRVLSAGGEGTQYSVTDPWYHDQFKANLYCPRYLYKNDGVTLAQRPVITSAPTSMSWGRTFTLCTPNPSQITRVALVRPGVTTHAFDENQRYVPLSFGVGSGPDRLLVQGPASGDHAPPGYYMLFITGVVDGAETLPDVPSIARWVRVGPPSGRDTCDVVGPAGVGDFTVATPCENATAIDLSWTAPADDGVLAAAGLALSYEVRYSTTAPGSDVPGWFENVATVAPEPPAPQAVGTAQSMQLAGLNTLTTYWIGIRAVDDNQQKSAIATRSIQTRWIDCGGFAGGGEGGGGGSGATRDAGALAIVPGSVTISAEPGNSLFEGGEAGSLLRDAIELEAAGGGSVRGWIRSVGEGAVCLDRVRAVGVDHAAHESVWWAEGRLVVGVPSQLLSVARSDGRPVELSGDGVVLAAGEWLEVALEPGATGERFLRIEAQYASARPRSGLSVELPAPDGSWQPHGRLLLRRDFSEQLVSLGSVGRARLYAHEAVMIRGVGSVAEARDAARAFAAAPVSAALAEAAAEASSLAERDQMSLCVPGGLELDAHFTLPEPTLESRTVFLELEGEIEAPGGATRLREAEAPAAAGLRLFAPRPHPASGSVAIEYELPEPGQVRLEVFDLLGRRVAALEERLASAGRHRAAWVVPDQVAGGVFVIRLSAGDARLTRKLVVAR